MPNLRPLHNLMLATDSNDQTDLKDLRDFVSVFNQINGTQIKVTAPVAHPVTILPIYYFKQSKNDPRWRLKFVGLRTEWSRTDIEYLD